MTGKTVTAHYTVCEDDFAAYCQALTRWNDAVEGMRDATRSDWTDGLRYYVYYVGPSTLVILLLVAWSWFRSGDPWPYGARFLGLQGLELLPALALVIALATWISNQILTYMPQPSNNSQARVLFDQNLGQALSVVMGPDGLSVKGPKTEGTYSWETAFVFIEHWHGHMCLVHTDVTLAIPVTALDQPVKDIPDLVNDWCRQAKSTA